MSTETKQGSIKDLTEKNFKSEYIFRFNLVKKNKGTTFAQDEHGRTPLRQVFGKRDFTMYERIKYFEKDKESKNYAKYKNGAIRYIRYIVGEDSIFKDEQSEGAQDITNCNFVDGYKVVKGDDANFLYYMSLSNYNKNNPNRLTADVDGNPIKPIFYLYDKNAIVENIIKTKQELRKTIGWIYDTEQIDLVMAYAMVLVPDYKTISKDEVLLRMEMIATQDLNKFIKGMDNEAVLKKYYILKAIDAGKLELNDKTNTLYWDSGAVIVQAPTGISPIDMFVDNTMTDSSKQWESQYLKVLSKIGKLREEPKVEHFTDKLESEKSEAIEPSESDIEKWKPVVEAASKNGVVTKNGKTHFIFMKDTVEERIFAGYRGLKGIVTALVNEPEFAKDLLTKVGEPAEA